MTSPVRAPRVLPDPQHDPRPRQTQTGPRPERRTQPDQRHLAVVSAPSSRRRRTGSRLALATLVVFASMIAAGLFHSQVVSGQARLDRMDRQIAVAKAGLVRDRLALADQQSPVRIAEAARARGMVPSSGQHWLSPDMPAPATDGTTTDSSTTDSSTTDSSTTGTADPPNERPSTSPPTDSDAPAPGDERAGAPDPGVAR